MIEVFFNPAAGSPKHLSISIDHSDVQFVIDNNKININDNCDIGIHTLRIQLLDVGSRLEIQDVKINSVSVRQTLYFGWIEQNKEKLQPATVLWDTNQVWTLPFLNPVSHWIGLLGEKLEHNVLGKNLFDLYRIHIPESIEISSKYPQGLRDFFKYDFDCVIVPRQQCRSQDIPFETFDLAVDISSLYQEIYQNLEFLKTVADKYIQVEYNLLDDPGVDLENIWFNVKILKDRYGQKTCKVNKDTLPLTYGFVDSLGIDYYQITITVLPPGGYLYPHIDRRPESDPEEYKGCKDLYIPLNYPAGAAIKFRSAGVPLQGPIITNPQYFSHAVVNDSDQTRIVLIVSFDYQHKN